jgi:positive regulator of sigma E activity
MKTTQDPAYRKGRQAALVIVATAVLWVLATLIGDKAGLSQALRLVFDLAALAGFVFAFRLIFQYRRMRRDTQG